MTRRWIDLTSTLKPTGELKPIERAGPVVPVSSHGETRYYLQDGAYLPFWLVWARRRKHIALALLALAVVGYGLARLIGGAK